MSKAVCLSGLAGLVAVLAFATTDMNASPLTPAGAGMQNPARPVITGRIDDAVLVRLAGNTRPEATAKHDLGRLPDEFRVDHVLLQLRRSPEQERALEKLIDQLNNKTSPNFHKWLTAEQFGQYGLAQDDLDAITKWLLTHGFVVNTVYPNHVLIDFSGTAGAVREAFHTELHQLAVGGQTHIANMSDPQIPAALGPAILGLVSLNDFRPHPMYRAKTSYPADTFAGCAATTNRPTGSGICYAVTPQDTQTIYNLNPLYSSPTVFTGLPASEDGTTGISGQGQTIVLVEDTDTYSGAGDWNVYRKTFGLARSAAHPAWDFGTYTQVHPGCADPGTNGDDGEAAIDVEVATSVAPAAAIELISCASGTFTFGGLIALQNLINEAGTPPAIVSVSYGVCEAFDGAGGNAAFFNTYQQAASEGVSVFVSSGDEGASSCSNDFSVGTEYDVASIGITGWGETPYNVSVGGTDFEDTYNVKFAGASFSTYWNSTNNAYYGSAKQYVPEIPWNDACASVLISNYVNATLAPYGAGTCNKSPYNGTTGYLIAAAASGGPSNCATGGGGTSQGADGVTLPECQGYAKPSWQSGSSLAGGKAVFGQSADGVRDIPDVSLFAANGIWGHYEVVCWSDPAETSSGSVPCNGNPSTWSGFGGTSVAAPTMAAIQALVNQKTGQSWGNPNPIYYQIAQTEYGVAGGTFLGGSCNSSGSPDTSTDGVCAFYDITQGDIDVACRDNGTLEENHCYKPSSTQGVDSTSQVVGGTVINGGVGYTSAPACSVAAPSNLSKYLSPTATTLYAGGTQAVCTSAFNAGSTTAKWTILIASTTAAGEQVTVGPTTYTLTGATTAAIATNLSAAINSPPNPVATATISGSTVTVTAIVAGHAGNFNVTWATGTLFGPFYVYITNTTLGQGPGYVSGITITTAGVGYGPDTPITLTGGAGTGAIAVANTTPGTAPTTYQPAFGTAAGWDFATGIGTVNAYNLVNNPAW